MADKAEEKTESTPAPVKPEAQEQVPAKKGLLAKYGLYGGIGFAAIVMTVVAVMFLTKGSAPSEPAPEGETTEQTAETDQHATAGEQGHSPAKGHGETPAAPPQKELADSDQIDFADELQIDSTEFEEFRIPDMEGDDTTILSTIKDNLAFLDYTPEEPAQEEDTTPRMSAEDSIKEVNWLEAENAKLEQREKTVAEREKQLEALDKSVSRKMLTLEQEESSRVSKLAKLYDAMDSRSVAQLMANLDDETVVAILPRMNTKNASQVMQLMPPARAANLSRKMITIAESK